VHLPLRQAAELGASGIGKGLGLYACRDYEVDEVIFSWEIDGDAVLQAPELMAKKFQAGAYGALAFQVLKAARSTEPSPWRDWFAAGAESPRWHPCRLLGSNPALAQEMWMSTTCGSSMSSTALDIKDDLELLKGQSDLEEWSSMMALVMSRSLVKDPNGEPMLVLGIDFLQDGDSPNVEFNIKYRTEGGGFLGLGPDAKQVPIEVELVARQSIVSGEELTCRYFEREFPGKYLEIFGFVPGHMRTDFGATSVQLEFAPTDEEEDWHFNVKEQMLEDIDMTTDPIRFVISSGDAMDPPEEETVDYEDKSVMGKIAHILRLKNVGGEESYLIEPVFIKKLWGFCNFRISKNNELAVLEDIMKECDRWLELFQRLDGTEEPDENELSATIAMVRKKEADLLRNMRTTVEQSSRETKQDTSRRYWVDRRMEEMFEGVRTKNLKGNIQDI